MRFLMTSFAVLLTLVAFGPTQTLAKDPGGGQGRGRGEGSRQSIGQQGTGNAGAHHEAGPNPGRTRDAGTNVQPSIGQQGTGNAGAVRHVNPQFSGGATATPESWRYRSDNGRWWYWTPQNRWMWYGDDGRWMAYSDTTNAYAVERPILENPLPQASFSGGPITITNPAANGVTLSYTLDGTAYTIPPGYSQELSEDRAWVIQFSRGESLGQTQYGLQSGLYSFTGTGHGWELYRSEVPASQ